jgi:hypothetical protein
VSTYSKTEQVIEYARQNGGIGKGKYGGIESWTLTSKLMMEKARELSRSVNLFKTAEKQTF